MYTQNGDKTPYYIVHIFPIQKKKDLCEEEKFRYTFFKCYRSL